MPRPQLIWKISLAGGLKRNENKYEVIITSPAGKVKGRGRTPAEAHRAAEVQLVVKPWVSIYQIEHLEEHYSLTKEAPEILQKVEDSVRAVLGGRLGYTAGIHQIAALFSKEVARADSNG